MPESPNTAASVTHRPRSHPGRGGAYTITCPCGWKVVVSGWREARRVRLSHPSTDALITLAQEVIRCHREQTVGGPYGKPWCLECAHRRRENYDDMLYPCPPVRAARLALAGAELPAYSGPSGGSDD